MLINFSVENFRSFGAEQTLNLIASGKFQDHDDHQIAIGETGKKVLRTGVVYGANAAGKSNLVRAIRFAQGLIWGHLQTSQIVLNQFRFRKDKKPSMFEFRFLANEHIYVYGFSIGQKAVIEEWLLATAPNGKEKEVFSRDKQEITIGNLMPFGKEADASRKASKRFWSSSRERINCS